MNSEKRTCVKDLPALKESTGTLSSPCVVQGCHRPVSRPTNPQCGITGGRGTADNAHRMKLRWLLLLTAVLIEIVPFTYQEDHGLMLPELAESEDGRDSLAVFDSQREDTPLVEDIGEPTRRVRGRTIKRRRRMRKRLRTTTEPPLEEQNENLNVAEQNPDVAYEPRIVEEVTAFPPVEETTRRRQMKRRRRPHRKYQDVQQESQGYNESDGTETTKPPRRRRKGGRRRRPTTTTEPSKIELFIETTVIPPEAAEMTTAMYEVEKVTEIPVTERIPPQLPEVVEDVGSIFQEEPDPQIYQVYDSRHNLVSQPSVELVDQDSPKYPQIEVREPEAEEPQLPEIYSTVAMPNNPSRLKPYSVRPAVNTIKPVKEFIQESESEQSEHHEERENKETNEVPSQAPTNADVNQQEQDYGNKIFDRKVLFSKSRKLPITSAIIRKKLYPRQQDGQVQAETNPTNLRSRDPSKNEVTDKQLIPEGFTVQPLTVEPIKLIERLKAHAKSYRTTTTALPTTIITTEEPNYPKFESKKEKYASQTENIIKTTTELYKNRFNKVVELHRSRGKVVITTPPNENIQEQTTTNVQIVDVETTEQAKVVVDAASTEQQTTTIATEKLNLDKLNDSIVDLLRSESGNMKLSEILESRNMTLAQLLEHRERGSSRFQLSDFFAEKKSLFGENSTASMNSDRVEIGTPVYEEKQTILFPSQDVLGSFPSFMSDKIEGGVQKSKDEPPTTRKSVHLENREPRVFDSMPEFENKKNSEQPSWKPSSPRLRPVSVRGNYEEIKISLHPSENPKINEVDNMLLLDDKADVLRTNRVTSTLEADSVTSQDTAFGRFRKIPVTVKSAIIISIAILILAIFGFLSVLISCRMRQKKARMRAKQDILCEHLKNDDFMNSQQSLSPVLTKPSTRGAPPVFPPNQIHSNTTPNRHYYLWRTLRKTFQYD